jgi:hypothetical protein
MQLGGFNNAYGGYVSTTPIRTRDEGRNSATRIGPLNELQMSKTQYLASHYVRRNGVTMAVPYVELS